MLGNNGIKMIVFMLFQTNYPLICPVGKDVQLVHIVHGTDTPLPFVLCLSQNTNPVLYFFNGSCITK
jgi:hypothetical protein